MYIAAPKTIYRKGIPYYRQASHKTKREATASVKQWHGSGYRAFAEEYDSPHRWVVYKASSRYHR